MSSKTYTRPFFAFINTFSMMAEGACCRPGLLEVMNAVGKLTISQTKDLAFRLGVDLSTLDDIDTVYRGIDRNKYYIETWLKGDTEASWKKIAEALKEMNLNVLAAEIASKHCSVPSPANQSQSTVNQGISYIDITLHRSSIPTVWS